LFLNKQNKLLAIEDLFSGTIDASAVFPRGVVEAAIKYQATGLIFVHNHPSGNPSPSQEDRAITRDLIFAARTIQVKVLDHIIIGDNCRFSFAAEGLIARYVIRGCQFENPGLDHLSLQPSAAGAWFPYRHGNLPLCGWMSGRGDRG